jgi:hypothetical protein
MLRYLFAVLSLFVLVGTSTAEQTKVVGTGTGTCRQFSEDIGRDPQQERIYFAWAQGLMSGVLLRAPAGIDDGLDLLPPSFPVTEQIRFISDFCRANPDKEYLEAVRALYRRLKALGSV